MASDARIRFNMQMRIDGAAASCLTLFRLEGAAAKVAPASRRWRYAHGPYFSAVSWQYWRGDRTDSVVLSRKYWRLSAVLWGQDVQDFRLRKGQEGWPELTNCLLCAIVYSRELVVRISLALVLDYMIEDPHSR